ncbi:MAG: hypothetical protein K1W13_07115 [Lachnospiraceae bacterium]
MKKIIALLAVVTILAGSVGMAASAAVDPSVCEHPNIVNITAGEGSGTYTHPYWVGNKPNGDPILVTCTVAVRYQKWKRICPTCGQLFKEWKTTISETHSIHH